MHINSQTKNAPEPMSDMNPESILSNFRGSYQSQGALFYLGSGRGYFTTTVSFYEDWYSSIVITVLYPPTSRSFS